MFSSNFLKRKFIYILISSGFLGFCITLLVYIKCKPLLKTNKDYTFHEPYINKNDIIDSFNKAYLDSTLPVFKSYEVTRKKNEHFDSISVRPNEGSDQISTDIVVKSKQKEDSLKQQLQITDDTERIALGQFLALQNETYRKYRPGKSVKLFDSAEVQTELKKSNLGNRIQLNFLLIDTIHKDFPLKKTISIPVANYSGDNIGFFEKYPDFGLWVLFTCTTVAVLFILSVIFFTDIYNYYTTVNDHYTTVAKMIPAHITQSLAQKERKTKSGHTSMQLLSAKKIIGFLVYSLVLVAVFISIQFITVYDHSVVPVSLFIVNYEAKFKFFLITGGIASSFFFGGYLTVGEVLKEITLLTAFINKEKEKENTADKQQDLENASAALGKICGLSVKNLKKYFYITSYILTAVVIVTGVLFSGINSLDISKLYNESFHSNLLNYDIIYLFGGLYSLLILFFYLPLRLTFAQVNERYPEAKPPPATAAEPKDNKEAAKGATPVSYFLNPNFLDRLKEMFAVSTPLLAAILQLTIDILSNK